MFFSVYGVEINFFCCFQTEEVLTVLKKLSSEEAVCVIERLTSWARLQLEDKVHISDEVGGRDIFYLCITLLPFKAFACLFKMIN